VSSEDLGDEDDERAADGEQQFIEPESTEPSVSSMVFLQVSRPFEVG
jgi:hypothetical protein